MKHFIIHSLECMLYCYGFHLLDAKFELTQRLIHFLAAHGAW